MIRAQLVAAALAPALWLSASARAQPRDASALPQPDAGALPQPDAGAQAAGTAAARPLRVLVAGSAPFVIDDGSGSFDGLSLQVWQQVASHLGLDVHMSAASSVDEALERIAQGQADALVGPVSIGAERAGRVAFTQPYFYSSLAIAAPASGSLFDHLRPFLTVAFLSGFAIFLATLLLVGTLIWLSERAPGSSSFPMDVLRGVGNCVWLALVTMTTVGYGDLVPRSLRGRVIAGVWMLASMLMASSITAFMATALTLSQIDQPALAEAGQLANHRVAVVQGTLSERFARTHGAHPVHAPDIDAALSLLAEGHADAVVFDEPSLRHALAGKPELQVQISAAKYWPRGYGFALQRESPLRDRITVELLRLEESGELDAIAKRWL